jgi:hypothetical protein
LCLHLFAPICTRWTSVSHHSVTGFLPVLIPCHGGGSRPTGISQHCEGSHVWPRIPELNVERFTWPGGQYQGVGDCRCWDARGGKHWDSMETPVLASLPDNKPVWVALRIIFRLVRHAENNSASLTHTGPSKPAPATFSATVPIHDGTGPETLLPATWPMVGAGRALPFRGLQGGSTVKPADCWRK